MNILHLASGDLWAGAEVQLFHLSTRLSRQEGIKLLVVLFNHGQLEDELKQRNISVAVLDETRLSGFAILRELNKLVKVFQPDIIHTHRHKENIIGGLIAVLNRKKSVRTVHGANEHPRGLLNFRRFILTLLDGFSARVMQQKIIAVSNELKGEVSNIYPPSRITVIENCVDINYVEDMSKELSDGHVAKDSFNVAFIGRFVQVKRVDLFYAIAKSAITRFSTEEINFHMLGEGPLKNDIDEMITRDKLGAGIHLHGFVQNVPPMLKQMDLLMITSDHEGLPMTLLEAMTLRVPVLSRAIPSIHRVLCNGECGYIVASDKVEHFVDAIEVIMTDTVDVNARVSAARAKIETEYNIDVNIEHYLQLYMAVSGKKELGQC